MDKETMVTIYNENLKKYWNCTYDDFLENWSKNGWVLKEDK